MTLQATGQLKSADGFRKVIVSYRNGAGGIETGAYTNAVRYENVLLVGNGIMHQINLERMSPVIQSRDGVAFPDTLVGTDSHTPMVDALGVLAVGVVPAEQG